MDFVCEKYNFAKTQWIDFTSITEESSLYYDSPTNPDAIYKKCGLENNHDWNEARLHSEASAMESLIWQGIKESTPLVPDVPKMPKMSWYTPELFEMKKKLQYINNAVRAQKKPRRKGGKKARKSK